jgi:hypothetical protein
MARPSAESKAVAPVTNLPSRLNPPEGMPEAEAELWRAVVATKPVDWFQEDSSPLLTEYVRCKVMCDKLAEMLVTLNPDTMKSLLDMRDKESRRLATIACKLRLTQQSRYTPQSANTASKAKSPGKVWQFGT